MIAECVFLVINSLGVGCTTYRLVLMCIISFPIFAMHHRKFMSTNWWAHWIQWLLLLHIIDSFFSFAIATNVSICMVIWNWWNPQWISTWNHFFYQAGVRESEKSRQSHSILPSVLVERKRERHGEREFYICIKINVRGYNVSFVCISSKYQ